MSDDGKVIDIHDWYRPRKPGELPRGCALAVKDTPAQTETSEWPRKMRPSEIGLAIGLFTLVSLLIASYV
jgi:hypothetical protein